MRISKKSLTAALLLVTAAAFAVPVIVIPKNANPQEKTAAEELALHLKLATGKTVQTVAENAAPAKGKRIFIGKTAFAQKNKVAFAKLGEEEHFVKAVSADTLIIAGGYPRGTIYGVYEFLENNLNAMWLDETDIMIDKVKSVSWKKDLKLQSKPDFKYRSIWNSFPANHTLYKIRNRQNTFHFRQPKKYDAYGLPHIHGYPHFCHTFYYYTKDLAKEDYDILSMTNGKRVYSKNSAGPGQICYSNPKTAAHFIKVLEKKIPEERKGKAPWQYPTYYSLQTNDNRNECECKNCSALVKKHGWMGAKMFFVNKVAKAFEKKYPEIRFVTDAYGLHGFPPKGDLKPGKNVTVNIAFGCGYVERPRDHFRPYSAPVNAITKKLHEDWAKLTPHPALWDYWNDTVRSRYPSNPIPTIAENIKFYKQIGVEYLMGECGGASVVSLWRLKNYIGYRLMVDSSRSADAEVKRFCKAFYGAAAPQMLEYYDHLYKATMRLKENIQTYTLPNRYDLDEAFFKKAEALLDAADKATKNDKLRNERVQDERVPIEWAKIEKFKISDKAYVERFRKNAIRRLKYQSAYHAKQAKPVIERLCRAAVANVPALKGFEKATVLADYAWPQLSLARYNKVISDPDAAGGKAVVPGSNAKVKNIACGIYDERSRQYLIRGASLPIGAVPNDGKYHWYYLGRCRLTASSLLYMHSSWTLQLPLAESMQGPEICDNDVAVYISMKVTDKVYAVDRVVTVRGDISKGCPMAAPLPAEIDKTKFVAEFSQIALCAEKIVDNTSAVRCAAKAGSLNKAGQLWTTFRDSTGKFRARAKMLTIPKDGKYHIISAYSGVFTRGSLSILGNIRLDIASYCAMLEPDKKYEIKVSAKADSKGQVFIDRVFILQSK